MAMKKIVVLLLAIPLFFGCKDKNNIPDVSGIPLSLSVQRFDKDFFTLDTLSLEKGISGLQSKYPDFLPLFFQNIIGVTDENGIRTYYRLYKPVFDSTQKLYKDFDPVKKQIEQALRYVKYYFPGYKQPAMVRTIVGPMNSMQDFAMMSNG